MNAFLKVIRADVIESVGLVVAF